MLVTCGLTWRCGAEKMPRHRSWRAPSCSKRAQTTRARQARRRDDDDGKVVVHRQVRRSGLDDDDAYELQFRLLRDAGLSKDQHLTAMLLLGDFCGIQIYRNPASDAGPTRTGGIGPAH